MRDYANATGLTGSDVACKQETVSENIVKKFKDVSLEARITIERLEEKAGRLFFVEHLPSDPQKAPESPMDNRPTLSGELNEIFKAQEHNLAQLRKVLSWMEQFI